MPDFSLPTTGGGTWKLEDAAGRKLVVYFYPRDLTSGCTREAQDFRDLYAAFRRAGTGERVCRMFDVIKPKSLYGRKYLGWNAAPSCSTARASCGRSGAR